MEVNTWLSATELVGLVSRKSWQETKERVAMAARAAINIFFMLVSSYKVIWTPKLTFLVFGKRLPVVPETLCSGSVPRLTALPNVRRLSPWT